MNSIGFHTFHSKFMDGNFRNSGLQLTNLPARDRGCYTAGCGLFHKGKQNQFWVNPRLQNRNYTALLLTTSAAGKHCWNKPLISPSSKLDEKTFTLYIQKGENPILPITVSCRLLVLWFKRQMSCVNTDRPQQLRQSLSLPKGTLMNSHENLQS